VAPEFIQLRLVGAGTAGGGIFLQGITIALVKPHAGVAATSLPMFNGQPASAQRISGLGDAAVFLSPGQVGPGSVQIFVATHGSLVTLTLVNGGSLHTANPVQSMTVLATAVVARFSG